MAADKTSKRKRTSNAEGGSKGSESESAAGSKRPALRNPTDPRSERRYEPKPSMTGTITIVGAAIGALLAGAGTYAQWFRAEALGPLKWAPYMLAAGAVVMIAVAVFGDLGAKIVRVGDAGVAVEKDGGEIDRIAWYDVSRVALTPSGLAIHSSGTFITIPRGPQEQAIARVVAELKERLPSLSEDISSAGLEKLDAAAGTIVALEAQQAAGQRCKNSEKIIAFEKDARFCGRCGEIYHKDEVPRRCLTCDAPLRSKG